MLHEFTEDEIQREKDRLHVLSLRDAGYPMNVSLIYWKCPKTA
ncbi:hypothetical protein QUF80_17245 [Desulfococcaceae bacterium HSG8]|nr:hypothetical protein [Desulfococcaceae bacterium HSG8]